MLAYTVTVYTITDSIRKRVVEVSWALHLTLNISETVRNRGLVPKDHQLGNGLGPMGYQMVT